MKYVLLILVVFYTSSGFAQDGKSLFNRHCTACHTVGGGKKVGPDLKGITNKRNLDWLVKFIKSSKDLISAGDADANAIFNEFNKTPMPSHNMSNAEIQSILTFVANGGDNGSNASASNKKDTISALFIPNVNTGRQLFTGELKFTNSGPSCISCHALKDSSIKFTGTFAKDLSVSYVEGIVESMLSSMPAMINAYSIHELTIQEKSHLEIYLKTVKENQIYNHTSNAGEPLILFSIILFIVMLLIINIFWRHTKKYGVKDEIYNRQIKTQ